MLVWSFIQSMTTDPGQVPVFWGFHLGDPENKRRRYCLMCNIFKPERCHHCSSCNRCVLNMDHHCPWTGNCIGLLNHKQFWLFLFYSLIGLVTMALLLVTEADGRLEFSGTMVAAFGVSGSLFILLSLHTMLLLKGWSTLEMGSLMDDDIFASKSKCDNWRAVFGQNFFFWFVV